MNIVGYEKFRQHFSAYSSHYVLIGGVASFMSMEIAGAGEQFARTTRDFDMVIIIDEINAEFQQAIWGFIRAGEYDVQSSEEIHNLYRFTNPKVAGYPVMLELFSRVPQSIEFEGQGQITPIPADEAAESLSALIMDESAYQYLRAGKTEHEEVSFIGPDRLIPLKIKAYYDIKGRGESSKKYNKHLGDVFKLTTILPVGDSEQLPPDMHSAVQQLLNDEEVSQTDIVKRWGLKGYSAAELLDVIRNRWS